MHPDFIFRDRLHAGRILATKLQTTVADTNAVILALPRGGVPVAAEVSRLLSFDLDIFLVRKIGLPGQPELAIGAIAEGGIRVLNRALIEAAGVSVATIERITRQEAEEIERRTKLYRQGRPALPLQNRTVILVDDGLATGATMMAAVRAVRTQRPQRVIVAVPVASRSACEDLAGEADRVICVETPEPFYAVGAWYEDFRQTSDEEVQDLLERASRHFAL